MKKKNVKRLLILSFMVGCLMALATSCASDASQTDLKEPKQKGRAIPSDYSVRAPDKLTVWQNINEHPTIAQVCIDGVAFATTSRDYNAILRVPEWDDKCKVKGDS